MLMKELQKYCVHGEVKGWFKCRPVTPVIGRHDLHLALVLRVKGRGREGKGVEGGLATVFFFFEKKKNKFQKFLK